MGIGQKEVTFSLLGNGYQRLAKILEQAVIQMVKQPGVNACQQNKGSGGQQPGCIQLICWPRQVCWTRQVDKPKDANRSYR